MRKWGFVLIATLATSVMAREPELSGMRAYPVTGYTIVTHDEESARKMVPVVEGLRQTMTAVLGTEARHSPLPTQVFVVPLTVWRRYLQPEDFAFGEFHAARFRNYILIANSGDQNPVRETALHEFAHYFLRSQREGEIPTWYDEGMATFMSMSEFRDSQVLVGTAPELRNAQWWPLEELLRLNPSTPNYWGLKYSHRVLLESWALVHRGLVPNEEFARQTQGYLHDVGDDMPVDDAAAKNFGMSVKELNSKIQNYLLAPSHPTRYVPYNRIPIPDKLDSREVSEVEALELLAQVMLDSSLKPERVEEVIEAIEKRAPGSATAQVLRLRWAMRNNNPARLESAWKEIEPAARDAKVGRDAALAVFERLMQAKAPDAGRAADHQRMRETAFGWLGASLAANPKDPEAAWAYGILAAQLKRELDPAMQYVRQAREQLPESAELALSAALLHEARKEANSMLLRLRDVARFTRSPEERRWARRILK